MAAASYDGNDSPDRRRLSRDGEKQPAAGTPPEKREPDELAKVRESLHSVPEMSGARIGEIKDRIKRGYYSRSDVVHRIAKRLTSHLVR